ncbi:MAG: CRISPR-associated helicase Cas3' [Deltaproteobacteria bacterium]|nr:CRISPR-associated helicase Cas3' [Deltaproteobacteria bacterium]
MAEIFSCLVDADYLDTEHHCAHKRRSTTGLKSVVDSLLGAVLVARERKRKSSAPGCLADVRNAVFDACFVKALQPQGFFSLTLPTGGGKTLSAMAFALAHAKQWSLDRIIVVIPYLSIIEQNAAEYRKILDPDDHGIVVEHHSAVRVDDDAEATASDDSARLAVENWDAPIIVTTSVQFVESLFARSPARCRKLHNIARSVVVLDEVQTLPARLLNPLLSVLRELRNNYGCTFVFSTATQPAFRRAPTLTEGLAPEEVKELVDQPAEVFGRLRRVRYSSTGRIEWDALASRLACHEQVLCVVNVRRHAFELWERLQSVVSASERDAVVHLSSAMCAEHRLALIGTIDDPGKNTIRQRLKKGQPCRLVSTQVVEAGVDLDFPVLYRALGPLDSIVQAAGRCNREGLLRDKRGQQVFGEVNVFTPADDRLPGGVYNVATNETARLIASTSLDEMAAIPDSFERYFSNLFQYVDTDHHRQRECSIQDDRRELRFREVARKARVIDHSGTPVVAPYGRAKEIVESMRARKRDRGEPRFDRDDLRALQRFMVNLNDRDFLVLRDQALLTALLPGLELFVIEDCCYHPQLGVLVDRRPTEEFCV